MSSLSSQMKSSKVKVCDCLNDKAENGNNSIDAQAASVAGFHGHNSHAQSSGEIIFYPVIVQSGNGPYLLDWAYANDENGDAFHSDIKVDKEGVRITTSEGTKKFGINVRWNVEGFGYIFLTADNGGEFYQFDVNNRTLKYNLNFELAKSRVLRNTRRLLAFQMKGYLPNREINSYLNLSTELYHDAEKCMNDPNRCGYLSQRALYYALWGSEMLELDYANFTIKNTGFRREFYLGCDARAYYQISKDLFMERFLELFNYANLTYVVNGDEHMGIFEPQEGHLNFQLRDILVHNLKTEGITVAGRPLFWFHKWVTPDWLKKKSFSELLNYVEKHTREVVSHYGNGIYAWEIVNELHDWANECLLSPDQTIELTRLAYEVAKSEAPGVHRLINNCCPFAEYVQLGEWSGQKALYPQRTPWQFTRDLVEAGVDFTLIGQQIYFPYRDLQDTILLIERFANFGKKIQLSEIGCSAGPTEISVKAGTVPLPKEPYAWHRPWDEELQADWLEGIYTLAYSKPYIEAANWFDLVDPYSYIDNGGLLKNEKGEKKSSFIRLKRLSEKWKKL